MNSKQIIQAAAKIAPPVLIGVAFFSALKWLLTDDSKDLEKAVAKAAPVSKLSPIPSNSTGNSPENRVIPANSSEKLTAPLLPAVTPAYAPPKIPILPLFSVPVTEPKPEIPLPARKKFITRADMAKIFKDGARVLTRQDAVAGLIGIGFGKSAAYEALSADGRFTSWLQFASDGIITWKS